MLLVAYLNGAHAHAQFERHELGKRLQRFEMAWPVRYR